MQANQRVVVDAYKGVRKTVPWPRGQQLKSLPRFQAGIASAEVAVQKVTGQFSASPAQVNCGDSAHLTWSSDGAAKTELNGAPVSASGDQTVQPKQTTDYKFTAAGPGGVYTSDATVNVNTAIPASLSVSPAEVRYHKIGDKVDQQGTATVTWSAPNADSVSVDPLGSVGASGNREIQVTPTKTSVGPIDETVTYTLHASNACGGSETRTATLHITGSIDVLQATVSEATLETKLTFNSIYFPTNLPTVADPQGGLVPSQEKRLEEIVTNFKQYLAIRPEANLILEAHADLRGSVAFNKALSQRRADLVKSYLVEHGIPAERIETQALGKEKNLTDKEVEDLTAQNPNVTPEDRKRVDSNIVAFRMANNRRVDVHLSTTGQTSQRFFPYNSDDLNVLLGEQKPVAKKAVARKAPARQETSRQEEVTSARHRRGRVRGLGELPSPGISRLERYSAFSCEVHCGQRVAARGICEQQYAHAFSAGRRGRRGPSQLVHLPHQQEHRKRHNHKIDDGVQKDAVIERRSPRRFGGGHGVKVPAGEVEEEIGKVYPPQHDADGRHQNVVDQRGHNAAKRRAQDNSHGHVEHVSAHGKFPKFF